MFASIFILVGSISIWIGSPFVRDETPSIPEFQIALELLETANRGYVVEYQRTYSHAPEPNSYRVWTSTDGKLEKLEMAYGSDKDWATEIGYFSRGNQLLKATVETTPSTGQTYGVGAQGSVTGEYRAAAMAPEICAVPFGLSNYDCCSFREIIDRALEENENNVVVKTVNLDNAPCWEIAANLNHTEYRFWFRPDVPLRLRRIEITMGVGSQIVFPLIANNLALGEGDLETRKSRSLIFHDIEYDPAAPYVINSISGQTTTTFRGSPNDFYTSQTRLISREKLESKLVPNKFEIFEIPEKTRVFVGREDGVLYEFRNGNIVKIIDGKSVEVIDGIRMRRPGFFLKWRSFLLAGMAAGVFFIWYRFRTVK